MSPATQRSPIHPESRAVKRQRLAAKVPTGVDDLLVAHSFVALADPAWGQCERLQVDVDLGTTREAACGDRVRSWGCSSRGGRRRRRRSGHHPFGFEVTGYSTFDGVTIPGAGRAG
ncbi:MAG: hypothetical protein ACRD1T_00935 [Acidimicrobiia bacterium]